MAYEWQDIFEEEVDVDGHIPQGCQDAQAMLDRFAEINYDTALDAIRLHTGAMDTNHIRQQIVDIIRNNPPLRISMMAGKTIFGTAISTMTRPRMYLRNTGSLPFPLPKLPRLTT